VIGLTRQQVLERLSAGAITAADALATLKLLNGQPAHEDAEVATDHPDDTPAAGEQDEAEDEEDEA
jgi:hypothetical protein